MSFLFWVTTILRLPPLFLPFIPFSLPIFFLYLWTAGLARFDLAAFISGDFGNIFRATAICCAARVFSLSFTRTREVVKKGEIVARLSAGAPSVMVKTRRDEFISSRLRVVIKIHNSVCGFAPVRKIFTTDFIFGSRGISVFRKCCPHDYYDVT